MLQSSKFTSVMMCLKRGCIHVGMSCLMKLSFLILNWFLLIESPAASHTVASSFNLCSLHLIIEMFWSILSLMNLYLSLYHIQTLYQVFCLVLSLCLCQSLHQVLKVIRNNNPLLTLQHSSPPLISLWYLNSIMKAYKLFCQFPPLNLHRM